MFIWVSRDPGGAKRGTKRSSARGTDRGNPRLLLPRGMNIWNKCGEKGICVPTRGATARGGVRDADLNMWERGECSGDRVEDRSAGSIRRRDRDTRRVRERGGRSGAGRRGIRGSRRGRGTTRRGLAWDLCHFNFSALSCSKLLNGGLQGLRVRRRCGQEGDELI